MDFADIETGPKVRPRKLGKLSEKKGPAPKFSEIQCENREIQQNAVPGSSSQRTELTRIL